MVERRGVEVARGGTHPSWRNPVVAVVALMLAVAALVQLPGTADAVDGSEVAVYRVAAPEDADAQRLLAGGYDVLEFRDGDDLFVMAQAEDVAALRADGFQVVLDRILPDLATAETGFTFQSYFGGYRTVDEHDAHLRAVADANPDLARVVDYGDSWLKTQGRAGGNDLSAICLTEQQLGDCLLNPNSSKPRAVIMAAIHARELVPAELAYRLIDELVAGYGNDALLTTILKTTEVWIIPVANPDGREIVESGGNAPYLQRKNANDDRGICSNPPRSFSQYGIDLNRNASFDWGGPGISADPCSLIYPGQSAASEPEQAALEALFADLWPARGVDPDQPVPADTTGTFLSIHSFGQLIFVPPGGGSVTPDDARLRAFAFRMSHYNSYRTGTAPEILYRVSGSTDDHTYGRHGVASATFELGPASGSCAGFTPAYSCVDNNIWPRNRDALLYALRVAGEPYKAPFGPTTEAPQVPSGELDGPFVVTAVADDDALGRAPGSVGRPTVQTVSAAEVYVGVGPWQGGTPLAMAATDGQFNETAETVSVEVPIDGLPEGRQPVYVRARDSAGNWGPVSAAYVTIAAPGTSSVAGTVTRNGVGVGGVQVDYFRGSQRGFRDEWVASVSTDGDGSFTFDPVDPGCWVATFVAPRGERFVDGNQWLNRSGCIEAGEVVTGVDAALATAGEGAAIGGSVLRGSDPVATIAVDLFQASADGGRGVWLDQVRTGPDGRYRHDVEPGCYWLTFIAPLDETFVNGDRWFNQSLCVTDGQELQDVDARLSAGAASISGVVSRSGTGQAGVAVDLFTAAADGSRGLWLRSTSTDDVGAYRFDVDASCYVMTFIAPDGLTFTNGAGWLNSPVCADPDEQVTGIDAVLAD